jgi:predicted AAA+ superfamily ATPase
MDSALLKPRGLLSTIEHFLPAQQILVITGMRQVGKTSLIQLIFTGLSGKQTYYFDLENLNHLGLCNKGPDPFVDYLKLMGADLSKRIFVAIDEIQYLPNPSNFLKLLYDHHPALKLIVSGSSSLEIKAKFRDSLAGRKIVFELDPLSFEEFLTFTDETVRQIKRATGSIIDVLAGKGNESLSLIAHHFTGRLQEYLSFGGYPGIALQTDMETKKALLRDIHTSYVRKDIKDIGRIDNIYGFNNLLQVLASQAGNLLNVKEVSATVGLSVNTVKRYLFLLENTFIITLLRPYHSNRRKELSKMPKIYFHDVGLWNTVRGSYDVSGQAAGAAAETFVFSELKKRFTPNENLFFWRTTAGAEVDFVIRHEGRIYPLEVKASEMKKPAISRSLRSFIDANHPEMALVINRTLFHSEQVNGTKVVFLPLFAL